ncbi:SGNH/GDSL hydrolase family protein [Halobacillus yeomjeoni]|uniref:SGNH/GDSL hydrolase family protein n=1 Tax=Halobacillus yeomjeoni TaxID=311194 RepID=A0A931MVC5_9BACI|nr:SGNH/GDSL hydrolase family protein [Halobacillus yeomjeoni]MBH0230445.1 SGNH/GDSL hydrolase family protein [Halobacillus yeomjeoni]
MKFWKWSATIALAFTIAFFIIAAFVYEPSSFPLEQDNSPAVTEEVEEDQTSSNEPNSSDDENGGLGANEKEGSLSEGLREAFTAVIDSARDLFIKEDLKIVAIGDSLTQGVGDGTDNGGYVGILEENFNDNQRSGEIEIINYGKRGNRTDQLLQRMESEEIRTSLREADIILITIGANDVMKVVKSNFTSLKYSDFVSAQQGYQDRLNTIIEKMSGLNSEAPIYLIGLYNPFDHYFNNIPELGQIISDYNRISKEVIDRHDQVHFIPIKDLFKGSEDELLWEEDYFHPNENGYKQMAERVLNYIRNDIEQ